VRRRSALLFVVPLAAVLFTTGAVLGRPSTPAQPSSLDRPMATDRLAADISRAQDQLRRVPGDWTTWAALGTMYVERARTSADPSLYPKAETALRRSLDVKPADNDLALVGLGALSNARHDFAAARTLAEQAIGINAYSELAYGVLADAHTQLGNATEATRAVQKMLDLRPGLASYSRASYDLELRGRLADATSLMARALEAASNPADIAFCRLHLGQLAFHTGDLAGAERHVTSGMAADGTAAGGTVAGTASTALVQLRAKLAEARGDYPAALADAALAVRRTPTADNFLEQARLQRAAGQDPTDALRLARAAHQVFVANGGTDDLTAAQLALAEGRPAEAVELALREWGRRQFAEIADTVAWTLHQAGRSVEALPYAQRAAALGTRDATVTYHRGIIALANGDRDGGRALLRQALDQNPHFSPVDAAVARRAVQQTATGGRA
jgi:tetratricopeptide (TPR) repeat protein